jgi:RNAse (barnase) inhibitor barstar
LLAVGTLQARESAPFAGATVAVAELPAEAQTVHATIRAGGPFAYAKDGSVFGNREHYLPVQTKGYYREYTVTTPGARTGAPAGSSAAGPFPSPRLPVITPPTTTPASNGSRHERPSEFQSQGGTRHALADSPSKHRAVDSSLSGRRPDAGGEPRRPAFPVRQPDDGQSKQEVLEGIAEAFLFPTHFGKNLDALYDCMTDLVQKAGSQPGFVVVLEQLPTTRGSTARRASSCLDVFRDAADYWAERKVPFRCFYSFQ